MKGKLNFGINLLMAAVIILAFGLAPHVAHAGQPAEKAPAAPGDGKWDPRFTAPGTNGRVRAIAVSGSDIYVGGEFTQVGGMSALRIAKWDSLSQTWSTLKGGVGNFVHDVAVSGPYVFVGGDFTDAGGQDAIQYIGMWDESTQSWSPLGDGVNGQVRAIAVKGSKVYVGGLFTEAGGMTVNGIATWDMLTQSWSRVGCGVKSTFLTPKVFDINVNGNAVYVGGYFGQVGNAWDPVTDTCVSWQNASNIASWDGDSWSALGNGVNNDVNTIAVSASDVFVGGNFTDAAGIAEADSIARWDGSQWNALGTGLIGATQSPVHAITILGSDVYVGGSFIDGAGIAEADRIARWDGSQWNALSTGMTNTVFAIAVSGTDIYAGGSFGKAGGGLVNEIARWDGSRWYSLGAGLVGIFTQGSVSSAEAIARSGDDIYAGGNFLEAGGHAVRGIARWDGSDWWRLGIGFNNAVEAVAVMGTDVYAGGLFTKSSDLLTVFDHIARWDGTQWNPVGAGLSNTVNALAVSGTDLYVGGDFLNAGAIGLADRIARWDGSQWYALGSGLLGSVRAIAVSGTDVYVGGDFTNAGGIPAADYVARWDGLQWNALGSSGLNGPVNAIAVNGTDVYVGGGFTNAGGNASADLIARWNGSSWSPLGTGIQSVAVHAVTVLDNQIYVGGEFSQAGGVSASNIARWDGSSWSALGSGTSFRVRSLAATDTDVYAGGLFVTAGGNRSLFFGRYTTANTPPELSYPDPIAVESGGSRTVNPSLGPSDDEAVVSINLYSVTAGFTGTITVDDATGVVSIEGAGPAGSYTVTIRATDDEGSFTDASFTLDVIDQGVCSLQTRIIADDGLAGDQFGSAVAMEGDTLVVGAPFDDAAGGAVNQGAAYVFVRQGSDWVQQQKLTAGDGTDNDYFGFSVDISGQTIIVSAPGAFSAETPSAHPGKAYVFVWDGVSSWSQQAMLAANDGAVNDQFGWSVGISGDYAVVGARLDDTYKGSAYVFSRSGVSWSQRKKLTESTGNLFGWSVDINGNTVAVGAPGDEDGAKFSQGSAYVYTGSGANWNLQQRLFASTPGSKAAFGRAVALSGETLAVGADLDDIGGYADQGAAYIFTRSGATWSEQQKLSGSDGAARDMFGGKVALSGDHVVAGARLADINAKSNQGAAYTFTRSGGTWIDPQKLAGGDSAAGDQVGSAVALSDSTLAVGSLKDDVGSAMDQGSVYLANCWLPDEIFADGFEAGLISWSNRITDSGDLMATAPAAMVGAKGMRALIDDNPPIWVMDVTPAGERIYRARFYFDPHSVSMADGDLMTIFAGLEDPSLQVMRVELRRNLGRYELRAGLRKDDNSWTNLRWVPLTDAPHVIEVRWQGALYSGASNGAMSYWVDGLLKANVQNVDNDTYRIDRARLGAVFGIDDGTRGTIYFDAFESRRKTYIGP